MAKKLFTLSIVAMVGAIIIIPSLISILAEDIVKEVEEEEQMQVWQGPAIKLMLIEEKEIVEIPLEEYLIGVVAAEMPAAFELEALKAQAVAARTYALRKMGMENQLYPDAHICDDPNHCQAWLSDEDMMKRWGATGYVTYKRKIQQAITETQGLIITHNNKLIDPVYHSTCGSSTENSEAVWNIPLPYLRSVPCRWGQESPRYQEKKTLTWDQINQLLEANIGIRATFTGGNYSHNSIAVVSKTATGRAAQLKIGNETIPATKVRSALGLNSTNMTINTTNTGVTFTTTGFGHGVGMCQYGANGQAKEGKSFQEILTYYYTDVQIQRMKGY